MTKELLVREVESLPPELLTEALDFIRFIRASHLQRQLKPEINSSKNTLRELHRIIDPIMRENNLSMHLTSCVQNLSLNSRRT